jgi:hypothetical protein
MKPPPANHAHVVIRDTHRRDNLIAVGAGLLLLVFVGYGVMHMGSPVKGNKLTGEIVEKVFTEQKERQITFSGRKIKEAREIAGEYVLKVRVPPDNRIYEVPVEEPVYLSKKVGDTMTFMRPPSEQR